MVEHTNKRIVIQLFFEDLGLVSRGLNRDLVSIKVLQPSIFRSKRKPFLAVDLSNQHYNTFVKEIPKQVE